MNKDTLEVNEKRPWFEMGDALCIACLLFAIICAANITHWLNLEGWAEHTVVAITSFGCIFDTTWKALLKLVEWGER